MSVYPKSSEPNVRSVLIVDDEPGIRTALNCGFVRAGWQAVSAGNVREAVEVLSRRAFDLVVSDMRMPDGDGTEVMSVARRCSPATAVILLTAFGSVPEAVQAMRGGAVDYLSKPISFEQLEAAAGCVMRRLDHGSVHDVSRSDAGPGCLAAEAAPAAANAVSPVSIVGRAPALIFALRRARAAAGTNADVLIEAESGTGKELLARFVHEASERSKKPFVAVNCAAVPEHLLESELFGHARGAFTGATSARAGKFELANGGTLLLDEIGEMPLHLQPKLLRALQEREFERLGEIRSVHVDIRVIATTNASLGLMVEQGQFRSDLYYRLNVIPLSLPPLRDRLEDIPLLAEYYAAQFARATGHASGYRDTARLAQGVHLDDEFLVCLQSHDWPGNVRELANFMRRVLSLNPGIVIDRSCFDREFRPAASHAVLHPSREVQDLASARHGVPGSLFRGTPIREVERLHLEKTLELANGNRTHAAEMLGISLRTVRNKIKEYGLPPRRYA